MSDDPADWPGPFDGPGVIASTRLERQAEVEAYVELYDMKLPPGHKWSGEWVDGVLKDVVAVPRPGVINDLRQALDAQTPSEPVDPFAPCDTPKVVDGVLVPAASVAGYLEAVHTGRNPGPHEMYGWRIGQRVPARPEFVLASAMGALHTATRAIGCYLPSGQWLPLWVGTDPDERAAALTALLASLAAWNTRGGRR